MIFECLDLRNEMCCTLVGPCGNQMVGNCIGSRHSRCAQFCFLFYCPFWGLNSFISKTSISYFWSCIQCAIFIITRSQIPLHFFTGMPLRICQDNKYTSVPHKYPCSFIATYYNPIPCTLQGSFKKWVWKSGSQMSPYLQAPYGQHECQNLWQMQRIQPSSYMACCWDQLQNQGDKWTNQPSYVEHWHLTGNLYNA